VSSAGDPQVAALCLKCPRQKSRASANLSPYALPITSAGRFSPRGPWHRIPRRPSELLTTRTAHNLPHGEVDAVETANWVPKLMRKGTSPSP
jgi:hypothetical protein